MFLGQPAKVWIIYLFFHFPMQIYTAFFPRAGTGFIVYDKTLSSGYLIQMGLCLDRLPAAFFLKLWWSIPDTHEGSLKKQKRKSRVPASPNQFNTPISWLLQQRFVVFGQDLAVREMAGWQDEETGSTLAIHKRFKIGLQCLMWIPWINELRAAFPLLLLHNEKILCHLVVD